jgi:purine-binding chemotaxis protein CheW
MGNQNADNERQFFERQLVVFSLGNEEFGVDISDVREIIKLESITRIPNSASYIDGILNLRGKIIVVIDLGRKLSLIGLARNANTRVIVTEIKGNAIGFIVDNCNEVLRLTGDKIEPAPKIITDKINSDYIQGVGILEGRMIILIDLGKIITDEQMENISSHTKQGAVSSAGNKKKVLIVEDSTMMRGTLKSYIDPKVFTILEAPDGEEGMRLVEAEKPDMVLLDIKLPKASGVDVLRFIKQKRPETKVVMETSVYEDETKNECMKLGAMEYLKKPVNKKDIEDVLAKI